MENRVVGMDANPYLAMAACLACGYLGMMGKIMPREPVSGDAYSLPHALPRELNISLSATGTKGLVVTLVDDDGSEVTETIDIGITTAE